MSTSPGPWRWGYHNESGGLPIKDANGGVVADVWNASAADAALITSAPDMLALIRKLSTWRPHGLEGQIEDDVAGIRQEACALLTRVDAAAAPQGKG